MTNETQGFTGRTEKITIESRFLGESRQIKIYLPHNYSPLFSYPVLYANDGSDYMSLGRMLTMLNQRFAPGGSRPFLAVFVPVDKKVRTEEYAPYGERHEAYVRFFAEELVPLIDDRYSTIPLASARGLIGSSLGATAALHTYLRYPRMFQILLLQSGAFLAPSLEAVRNGDFLHGLHCHQMVGLKETAFPLGNGTVLNFVEANRQMKDLLREKGAEVDYHEYDGDHTWGTWQQDLPHALDYFAKHSS
jgi:enterochelin esterase-like enzyme